MSELETLPAHVLDKNQQQQKKEKSNNRAWRQIDSPSSLECCKQMLPVGTPEEVKMRI